MLMFTAIMTSRRLPLYEAVLDAIKKHYPNFIPTTIMADFEPSLRKSIKLKFPKTRLLGCRYAFSCHSSPLSQSGFLGTLERTK
jgi:hypothetical protein